MADPTRTGTAWRWRRAVLACLAVAWLAASHAALAHGDASGFGGDDDHDHHDDANGAAEPTLYPAVVTLDPRKITNVTLKVNARIVAIKAGILGNKVAKGDTLGQFDSAELSTLQRTYIETVKHRDAMNAFSTTGEDKIIEGRMNLGWRGLSDAEIEGIEQSRTPIERVNIVSPIDGYVAAVDAVPSRILTAGSRDNLFSSSGVTLFRIAGEDAAVVEAFLPRAVAEQLRPGSTVGLRVVSVGVPRDVPGIVDQVDAVLNPLTRLKTVRIRPSTDAARFLMAGMVVQIVVPASGEAHAHP